MNTERINQVLLNAIKQRQTEETTILETLMNVLHLSKEAAYRRLRGDVIFSLQEAILITESLQLSMDQIFNPKPKQLTFELRPQRFYFEEELRSEYKPLEDFLDSLKIIAKQPESEFAISSNTFTLFPGHLFYQIFKYSTFKYMYENENIHNLKPFKEINVPESFFRLNKDIVYETMNIKETSYLFYSRLFSDFADEIRYFRSIHLMDNEDIDLIKVDLNKFVDMIEELTRKEHFETGNKVNIYISNVRFDTSYSYIVSNTYILGMIGAFSVNHLTTASEISLRKIKERIQALKRVSELISGSGEMKRIQFINEQRKIIETL